MSLTKMIITDENNNEYYPKTSSDIVYMGDGSTLEDKMTNHSHSQYLTEVPDIITKKITFEQDAEVQKMQPSTANNACYYAFYKDKVNRSGYFGYESSHNNHFVIKNESSDAHIEMKTTGTNSEIAINNLRFANGGSLLKNNSTTTIHADVNASSDSEFLSLKAGHNELKVISSGGGTTTTQGNDKLTFNGNVVYHEGNKPTANDIGAANQNHIHQDVTTGTSGFMSSTDKTKLDGIEDNANNYIHPTNSGNKHIPVGGMRGQILVYGGTDGTAVWADQISIIDNRTSTSTTDALSANQGKLLNDRIDTLETHIGGINTLLEQTINEINTVL